MYMKILSMLVMTDLTRYFIAPEVLLNQEDMINKNADKYSLGMLMLYLLTNDFYSSNISL